MTTATGEAAAGTSPSIRGIYAVLIIACFFSFVSPPMALIAGILLSVKGIQLQGISRHTSRILQISIVLMGFGMNLDEVLKASRSGFVETILSVFLVMLAGWILGKLLRVERNITLLISAGTAICGGSAIAAVSPILGSRDHQNSFALIVVFVLNALALLIFPFIGHHLGMSQELFGNWAAIAIHDTSSVVGAGAVYGEKALQVATTVKLIRALWIIPLCLVIALVNRKSDQEAEEEGGRKPIKIPWFILWFVLAIVVANLTPSLMAGYAWVSWLGRRCMIVALLFIGSSFSLRQIRQSGLRSFAFGILLWALTAVISLIALKMKFS